MSTPEPEGNRRRRLVRSRRGRLICGVCSGLAAHFDIDPILFRIAFVGLAIFSGVGIVLYLVIFLLVPEEGMTHAPISLLWRGLAASGGTRVHIARGYIYKEIAVQLGISVKTVEAHVSAVLRKLQLSSRHELTRWAAHRRLVEE